MGNKDGYPLAAVPTLAVRDALRSARWYRERLGFKLVHERPGLNGTPVLVHLRRGPHQDVMLATAEGPVRAGGVMLTFWVDDLAELAGGPEPREGLRLRDPDGHELVFQRRGTGH